MDKVRWCASDTVFRMAAEAFDVVVIGAGPAGETVVSRTAAAGMKTALVEREPIGGECAYWACIPPGWVPCVGQRSPG